MIRTCEDCGKDIGVSGTICSDCYTARKMKNAKKIKFKDYDGDFIYNDTLYSNGEFEDMYREEFTKDSPKMVYATKISYKIGLDIEDELYNRAEDNGYEDMGETLDLKHNLLQEAQELIDKWVEEQGTIGYSYSEDTSTVVDLTELYNEEISKTQEDLIKEAVENEHGRGIELSKKRIYKHQVHTSVVDIQMGKNSVILSAQIQKGVPTFWATHDDDDEMVYRRFQTFETGEGIEQELFEKLKFIGTLQRYDGDYVTHLFEEVK